MTLVQMVGCVLKGYCVDGSYIMVVCLLRRCIREMGMGAMREDIVC